MKGGEKKKMFFNFFQKKKNEKLMRKSKRRWQVEPKNFTVWDKCCKPNTSLGKVTSAKLFENVSGILSKFEEILVIFRKFVGVFLIGLKAPLYVNQPYKFKFLFTV